MTGKASSEVIQNIRTSWMAFVVNLGSGSGTQRERVVDVCAEKRRLVETVVVLRWTEYIFNGIATPLFCCWPSIPPSCHASLFCVERHRRSPDLRWSAKATEEWASGRWTEIKNYIDTEHMRRHTPTTHRGASQQHSGTSLYYRKANHHQSKCGPIFQSLFAPVPVCGWVEAVKIMLLLFSSTFLIRLFALIAVAGLTYVGE